MLRLGAVPPRTVLTFQAHRSALPYAAGFAAWARNNPAQARATWLGAGTEGLKFLPWERPDGTTVHLGGSDFVRAVGTCIGVRLGDNAGSLESSKYLVLPVDEPFGGVTLAEYANSLAEEAKRHHGLL
ncbi:hypothetical protein ACIA8O_18300 [Kitasatospora sp. NPDC051853]|uniref:hypothetical protein n=1 Tax=Kitasatospora sp. NPDC051853 TaxID=3364058 RepID=UPI0037975423